MRALRLDRFIVAASALHVAVLALGLLLAPGTRVGVTSTPTPADETFVHHVEVDVVALKLEDAPPANGSIPDAEAPLSSVGTATGSKATNTSGNEPAPGAHVSQPPNARPVGSPTAARNEGAAASASPHSLYSAGTPSGSPEPAGAANAATTATTPTQSPTIQSPSPGDSAQGEHKSLSLADMGFGKPTPYALGPDVPDRLSFAENNLERSMAQATLDEDRAIGLGSHALVTQTINQVATGLAPPRGKARLSVYADAKGNVTAIDVLEANGGFDSWRKVAEQALTALLGKRLSHQLGHPTRMLFEVESKVQLPSGRAPGANVTVLGIPIESSGDDESTQVKILSPEVKIEMVEVLDPASSGGDSVKVPVPMIKMTILGVDGDLVDIAAPGRQVVHTRLVKQDVL